MSTSPKGNIALRRLKYKRVGVECVILLSIIQSLSKGCLLSRSFYFEGASKILMNERTFLLDYGRHKEIGMLQSYGNNLYKVWREPAQE